MTACSLWLLSLLVLDEAVSVDVVIVYTVAAVVVQFMEWCI